MKIACCRCGGPTRLSNEYGYGTCIAGSKDRTCGHWWRRDGGCRAEWTTQPDEPEPGPCPFACGWDHRLYFQSTVTTAQGNEHRYHAPGCHGFHRTIAVCRPRGSTARLATISLSPSVDPSDKPSVRRMSERLYRMRGWSVEEQLSSLLVHSTTGQGTP